MIIRNILCQLYVMVIMQYFPELTFDLNKKQPNNILPSFLQNEVKCTQDKQRRNSFYTYCTVSKILHYLDAGIFLLNKLNIMPIIRRSQKNTKHFKEIWMKQNTKAYRPWYSPEICCDSRGVIVVTCSTMENMPNQHSSYSSQYFL